MNFHCPHLTASYFTVRRIYLWSFIFILKITLQVAQLKVRISRDSVKSHQNFCTKQGFQFELLSDADEQVCRQFDVLKPKKLYGKEYIGIERSTFILNEQGEIVHEWRKVKVANHAQIVLETILAA